MHDHVLPIVEGVLDAGCLVSSLSSIRIQPGETAAADPRRRPADAARQAARRPRCATRCGRSPTSPTRTARPASSRARTSPTDSPDFGSSYDSIPAEMPRGSVLVWHGSLWHGGGANTTDERPHRHRDELLRRLDAPAGEPAARHPRATSPARSRRGCASSSGTASTTG